MPWAPELMEWQSLIFNTALKILRPYEKLGLEKGRDCPVSTRGEAELGLAWVWGCWRTEHVDNELETLNPSRTQAWVGLSPPLEARQPLFFGKAKKWDLFSLPAWFPPHSHTGVHFLLQE